MGRGSREEKLQKRAREEVATALRRGDVERAVAAILALPPGERAGELPAVAQLFRAAVIRARGAGDWARVDFWASRAEREPGLIDAGAGSGEVAEVRWALYWSAVRARQWDRARGHLPHFAGQLPQGLRVALLALVDDAGAPAPEVLRPFAAAEPDSRLGYDRRTRQRPAPAAPASAERVEPAVLALAGLRNRREFVATIERWAEAPPALSSAILRLAVRLLPGAILERAGQEEALEGAAALARFVRRFRAPEEFAAELGLALRIAGAAARACPEGLDRDRAARFLAVVIEAARRPELRAPALALAVATPYLAEGRGVVLEALEQLTGGPDARAVPFKALAVWALGGEIAGRPPAFVVRGIEAVLELPGALPGALAALPVPTRQAVVGVVSRALPLELAERFLDQAWACEDLVPREPWLDAFDTLILEARMTAVRGLPAAEIEQAIVYEAMMKSGVLPGPEELAEFRRLLSSPDGRRMAKQFEALDAAEEGRPLPPAGRRIWERFAVRTVPLGLPYLELALEQGVRKPERMALVAHYLGPERRVITDVIGVLATAEKDEWPRASKALVEFVVTGVKGKREIAAQALVMARRRRLRRGICGPLARAFEAEDARIGETPDDPPAVRDARLELRLLGGRKRASGNPAGGGARRPARKAGGRARPRSDQASLPFGGKGRPS